MGAVARVMATRYANQSLLSAKIRRGTADPGLNRVRTVGVMSPMSTSMGQSSTSIPVLRQN